MVISKILKDEDMPVDEHGKRPDIILNPLGVIGRQNIGQLFEHELNYIADEIIRISERSKLFDNILFFLKEVTPVQHTFILNNVTTKQDKDAFINDLYSEGLFIHQPPFYGNAKPKSLRKLYKHFNIEKTKFIGINQPLVFGSIYFIQLKHEADSKFSVRSAGQVNLINVPFKSNEVYKSGNTLWNNSPIRFGEQEFLNMLMLADRPEKASEVINFLQTYSSDSNKRKNMLEKLLTVDINNLTNFSDTLDSSSNTTSVVRSYFKSIGINMETVALSDEIYDQEDDESEYDDV